LGFGNAFQLPIIMNLLSLGGLTLSKFWQKNFRYANTRWKRGHNVVCSATYDCPLRGQHNSN